jgi:endo-1,4-beta-xylanase
MRTSKTFRAWAFSWLVIGLGCTAGSQPSSSVDVESVTSALSGPISNDFEDGTTQGWFAFGSCTVGNSTDVAFSGTHSLLTTNRTATFNGPGTSLTGQLTAGATYHVSVAARLAPGQSPVNLKVTVMRTLSDGSNAFDSVVPATNVTPDAWVTLSGNYSFTTNNVTGLILYVESDSATASYYIDAFSLSQAAPAPLSYDFEDGTAQGWFPFGSPTVANSTDIAFTGTHSLKTTNRTASFMGPGVNMLGQLTKGATYQVTLSVRLVAGQPTSTLQATVQRTPTGGSTAFDSVASASNVTDQAWTTMTGIYSFATDNSTLIFYVQTASGNASYYIDAVSFTQVAPPPGPPGNTAGAASTFESQTTEGWKSRTGGEQIAVTNADAHGGSFSLLTSNRTATYQGPAFDVTNVMFNGSQYVVSLWAKLAPGSADTQLRVSLDRKLGTSTETFHTVVGNTTVTAGAWVRLQATYNLALANSSLTLYVESASGTPSFYIDDFSITYVPPAIPEPGIPSVYQSVASVFPIIGTAVIPADIQGQPAVLLSKHFNSITSGNDMKWDATEPTEGNFNFTQADAEVTFAQQNKMHVRGHTLVWHNQTPAWVFLNAAGAPMTGTADEQALLIKRLQNHITQVMTHFNTVPVWDVVNEPIDESQPDGYRRSQWFNILGPQYIPLALQFARAANPTAKLYINEFNTTIPAKRDFLAALVRSLKSQGIPLDGVGHQMHNNTQFPSPQSIIDAVNLFDTTGVEQAVTEMDVSIYNASLTTPFTSYTDIPKSVHIQDGYAYSGFVQALKQVSSKIVSITIWGTSDDKSWLTSSTKVDAPLLFDPSLQHKYAYWAFVDPLQLPGADLATTLTAAPTTVPAGQAVAYTIGVSNLADTNQQPFDPTDDDLPASNVSMTMAIPAHTGFASLTAPSGWTCSTPVPGASGQVTCTLGTLAAGASAQFALTVALNDCSTRDGSSITASASVTSSTADPNPAPNNTASASIVVSNPPPVITAMGQLALTVECATPYTDAGATAVDACDGMVSVATTNLVNSSVVGSYTVTYNAQDSAGSLATPVVRSVQVSDTTPPQLSVITSPPILTPPDHRYVNFPIASLATGASDTCDGSVGVGSVVITQVTSDEPDNGNGDGNTINDIVIASDCRSVQLRAERAGPLNGRVYTVTLRVKDASGNSTTKTVKVLVPLDASGTTAVDDGPMNTVLSACN